MRALQAPAVAEFPLGRAIPALLLAAAVCLPAVLGRSAPGRPDVLLWLPSPTHEKVFTPLLTDWRTPDGASVGMERIAERGLNVRLLTMFMGGRRDPGVPDLVQIEITQVGRFLRPPVDGVGLLPLDPYLDRPAPDGRPWRAHLLPSRLAPWSKDGVVFGIPFDLHPTALCWREDLWRAAGIDLAAVTTWDELHAACLRYEAYWTAQGHPERRSLATQSVKPDQVVALHLQRGDDVAGDDGPRLDRPLLGDTLGRYVRMIAGPRRIGVDEAPRTVDVAAQLADGTVSVVLVPDWRVAIIKQAAPALDGLLRLRPLPVFAAGDAPTTTWGGTMIGITRACPQPERAWAVIERLYLGPEALAARRGRTAIMPPVAAGWAVWRDEPADPFFAGQRVGALFADLAPAVPPRHAGPAATFAHAGLATVLNRARQRLDAQGEDGLDAAIAAWLAEAQAAARRALAHSAF